MEFSASIFSAVEEDRHHWTARKLLTRIYHLLVGAQAAGTFSTTTPAAALPALARCPHSSACAILPEP